MGENELLLFLLLTWAAAIVGGIWAYNSPKNYAPKKEKAEPPAPQGVPGYAETALYYNPRRLNNSPPEPVEYKSVEVKPPQPDNRVHVKAKLAMALAVLGTAIPMFYMPQCMVLLWVRSELYGKKVSYNFVSRRLMNTAFIVAAVSAASAFVLYRPV